MIDIVKTIKGLGCCIESDSEVICPEDCPYDDDGDCRCETLVKKDALRLLKCQETVEPFHKCAGDDFTLIEDSHFDFCPYCGKHIDWGNENQNT